MHDFTYPPKEFLVHVWRAYFKLLQIIGTPLFPAWREIFHGLPALIEQTRWCDELQSTLRENAFRDIHMRYLTLYGSALITARK
jgi:demethylmenaquinone methyltransferase/2-methoxy-6-polyprenyl-1,4-benzoquinol methylase